MRAFFMRPPQPARRDQEVLATKEVIVISLGGEPICACTQPESVPRLLSSIAAKHKLDPSRLTTHTIVVVDTK